METHFDYEDLNQTLYRQMKGQLSHEFEVHAPTGELWEIYRGLKLGMLVFKIIPHVIENVEVVKGDRGVGIVLKVTFPKGPLTFNSYKEKFTLIDDEKRLKETDVVERGLLELWFTLYRVMFEIVDINDNLSIIRSLVDYEVEDNSGGNVAFLSTKPLKAISEAIGKYLNTK